MTNEKILIEIKYKMHVKTHLLIGNARYILNVMSRELHLYYMLLIKWTHKWDIGWIVNFIAIFQIKLIWKSYSKARMSKLSNTNLFRSHCTLSKFCIILWCNFLLYCWIMLQTAIIWDKFCIGCTHLVIYVCVFVTILYQFLPHHRYSYQSLMIVKALRNQYFFILTK
jgi:hypothetical protein